MTHAHCRTCGAKGTRAQVASRGTVGTDGTGIWDKCKTCSSIDVDVMSDEGLAHEEQPSS